MKIDFFDLDFPVQVSSFEAVLTAIENLPDDEKRTKNIGKRTIRMQSISKTTRYWEGELVRIRMTDLPVKASLSGEISDIELEENEGIGEETAFLYDNRTSTLAIQRNRLGVSAAIMMRYVEKCAGVDEAIIPNMILNDDAIKMLSRASTIRKLQVRFAGIQNPSIVTNDGNGLKKTINLLQQAEAPVMDIALSMGYSRGSLPLGAVKQTATRLLRWIDGKSGDADVEKITITGRMDDDSPLDMVLNEYRMVETVDVGYDGTRRRAPYALRKVAVKSAWDMRRKSLEKRASQEN